MRCLQGGVVGEEEPEESGEHQEQGEERQKSVVRDECDQGAGRVVAELLHHAEDEREGPCVAVGTRRRVGRAFSIGFTGSVLPNG